MRHGIAEALSFVENPKTMCCNLFSWISEYVFN